MGSTLLSIELKHVQCVTTDFVPAIVKYMDCRRVSAICFNCCLLFLIRYYFILYFAVIGVRPRGKCVRNVLVMPRFERSLIASIYKWGIG